MDTLRFEAVCSSWNRAAMHKWADELPPELLGLIVKKLAPNFMDILRFEAVCSSWNRAARWYTSTAALTPQCPWLMLPTLKLHGRWSKPRSDGDVKGICFFSLAENKDYKMDWKASQGFAVDVDSFPGSSHDGWLVCNSSHGWLVMLEVVGSMLFHEIRGIRLFNPISRKSKTLPPLRQGVSSIRKVVLSSDPSRNNNFVVVIHDATSRSTRLTFYQHGRGEENAAAGAWTDLEDSHGHYGGYCDIQLLNNGHYLFALSFDHSIEVWDFGDTYNNHPAKILRFRPSIDIDRNVLSCMMSDTKWLLESMGELLLVEMEFLGQHCRGAELFYVYKLNIAAKKWEKVGSLRDCALFLDSHGSAMSLSTAKLPELEENSIYFADSYQEYSCSSFNDIHVRGVFSLETKRVKQYYTTAAHANARYAPGLWILPTPW
ncbi:F-box protein SKIP23 [Prunus yedoensis var. nudiflora]|uniref:F-box protein SKIP23 n=1 Tax=Prunus yedoensis var. nudiflora TaxID=2094558 RepID=A0A315A8K0_PRUYE|nr:F-box protein SKIP23 [Prunus yedoensis var. nudiflora]